MVGITQEKHFKSFNSIVVPSKKTKSRTIKVKTDAKTKSLETVLKGYLKKLT